MEKDMKEPLWTHPEKLTPNDCAVDLMKNDYMNTYISFFGLIHDKTLRPYKTRGFTQFYQRKENRYAHIPSEVTGIVKQKIEELDRLSIEANRLLDEPIMNVRALLEIAIKVAEICDRTDMADKLKEGIKE